jgi:tetratricopeptide (TPR) repeat protein
VSSVFRSVLLALVLGGLVWGVYANSLHNPFIFDDWHVIPQNPAVRGPGDIPKFFTDLSSFSILPGNRDYRPVFLTSMALAWWMGGGATLPFHIVSVSLHMLNVLLVFLIVRRMMRSPVAGPRAPAPAQRDGVAFLGASLFAVHPLASESVNYISSQSVPLAACSYLLAFLLFLQTHDAPGATGGGGSWLRRAASWTAYALALLSKPISATLPLILFLWELLLGAERATWRETLASLLRDRGRRLWKLVPYGLITVIYMTVRQLLFTAPFGGEQPIRPTFVHYLTQTKALVFYYLKLALFPAGLNADLAYPVSSSPLDPRVLVALAVFLVLGVLLWRFRRERLFVFWTLWFPVCLLVTTYGVVLRQVVNEHRVYLSLVGVCVVAGMLLGRAAELFPLRVGDTRVGRESGRYLVLTAAAALIVAFGLTTHARNAVWSSELTLWENAAKHGGTWRAHMNYALALENADRPDEALAEFRRALELGPYAYAHLNLGLAYLRRGDNDAGLQHLQTAVELWPTSPEAHLYLAHGLQVHGREAETEAELRRALELRPNYIMAHERLGALYEKQGRWSEALVTFERLHEIDPGQSGVRERIESARARIGDDTAAQVAVAVAEIGQGDYARAIERLETLNAQEPGSPEVLFNLGFAHQRAGNAEAAARAYEQLLALDPAHVQAGFNLAYACMKSDDPVLWNRGTELFRTVLELDPDYTEAVHHLATLHWQLGDEDEAARQDRIYIERGSHHDLIERSRARLAGR